MRKLGQIARLSLLGALSLPMQACDMEIAPPTVLSVKGTNKLTFVVRSRDGARLERFGELRVQRCDSGSRLPELLWRIARVRSGAVVDTVRYGEVPAGWRETDPAPVLRAGCYVVRISGESLLGHNRLRVFTDGSIGSLPDGPP